MCHQFAGVYTKVHHIVPESESGPNLLENAIVLCLRCHGEAGHYNPKHPIGNKYSPKELTRHRDEWWKWCTNNPAAALPENPISVSPGIIDLGRGEWKSQALLNIYNRRRRFIYQVWVKMGIDTDEVQPSDIKIETKKGDSYLTLGVVHSPQQGPIALSASMFGLVGTDQSGREAMYLSIGCIEPNGIYTLRISNESARDLSGSREHRLVCALMGFSLEPAKTIKKPGQSAVMFQPPENIQVHAILLYGQPES